VRDHSQLPDEVGKGYWPTICFSWQGIQVEVFEDHFEFYKFRDQQTDIEHFPRDVGEPLPPALLAKLPVR
jgi:hypothetical protein